MASSDLYGWNVGTFFVGDSFYVEVKTYFAIPK
jgi:hypothetical protein